MNGENKVIIMATLIISVTLVAISYIMVEYKTTKYNRFIDNGYEQVMVVGSPTAKWQRTGDIK